MRSFIKLLVIWVGVSFAITGSLRAQLYNFINYTVEDGIAQSNINDLLQDRRGYLWFATQKGICRFDGKNFLTLSERDSLVSNIALKLYEDSQNNLWIGTRFGISCYRNRKFLNFTTKDGLIDNLVHDIYEDRNHNYWICTEKGVSVFDGKIFRNEVLDSANRPVRCVYEDEKGMIWLGTEKGIYQYEFGTYRKLEHPQLKNSIVIKICKDKNGIYWFATDQGLLRYDGKEVFQFTTRNGLPQNRLEDLMIDSQNNIWLAFEGRGISRYDGTGFTHFSRNEGLTNNSVLSLLEDVEGNIWIGGRSGLSMFNLRIPFIHYTFNNRMTDTDFFGMCQDSRGNYWFTTYGDGIIRYDGNQAEHFDESYGIGDNRFFSVTEDHKGLIWFATASKGVTRYDGQKFENLNASTGFGDYKIFKIITDSKGNIWMATQGSGVIRYDGNRYKQFTSRDGLSSDMILSIYEDKRGSLWFAGVGGGLTRYVKDETGEKFIIYDEDEGFPSSFNRCITEDKDGNIWVGSASNGIIQMVNKDEGLPEFQAFNEDDGLNSANIYNLLFDRNGNLWSGTEKGVDKIIFNENYEIKKIKTYRKEDGFIGVESTLNGSMEDREGNIWFGTVSGISKYIPEYDRINPNEPRTYLRGVKLFYQEVDWREYCDSIYGANLPVNLELPHDKDHVTFDFIGISFSNPQKVRYQYILEGFDKVWSPATDKNEVVYSNLPPGKFTFKVRACNNDGIWNDNPTILSFSIAPPFWQKPWFMIISSLSMLVFGFLTVKWRFHELKEAKTRLEKKVEERTREITQQNDKIRKQKEDIERIKTEIENKNHDITSSISYAQRIQKAMLPQYHRMHAAFSDIFIWYQPKDIVSGDFYWFSEKNDHLILAAVDCTGHGVPGAFMALVGDALISKVINQNHVSEPRNILYRLNQELNKSLAAENGESQDGMDMSLCMIDRKNQVLKFSGAKSSLLYFQDGNMNLVKGDRFSIGGYQHTYQQAVFTNHLIKYDPYTSFYLFTDGFQDQFGGDHNKKFLLKRLKNLLSDIHHYSMSQQKQLIQEAYLEWKRDYEQVDDILMIGFRV